MSLKFDDRRYVRGIGRTILAVLLVLGCLHGAAGTAAAQNQAKGVADAVRALELKQYDAAIPALKALAEAGDADAQVYYGGIHLVGLGGVPEDLTVARRWFLAAAAKGHGIAQFNLGLMFERGQGTQADPVAAVAWYERAAAQDVPMAIHSLARCHLEGIGVVRDPVKAAEQLLRMARLGDPESQNMLGVLIGKQEIPGSQGEAYGWFSIAAAAGQDDAKRNLELVREKLTPEQIAEGERFVQSWRAGR